MELKFSAERFLMRPITLVVLFAVVIVTVTNLAFKRVLPDDPKARLAIYQAAQMDVQAEEELESLLQTDPANFELNTFFVDSYLDMLSGRPQRRLEAEVETRYAELAAQPETAEIGHYALGLIKARRHEPLEALAYYRRVHNPDQKRYVSNAIGDVYFQLGRVEQAEFYFWREIEMQGDVDEAVDNLVALYTRFDRMDSLSHLTRDPRTQTYVPPQELRRITLRQGDAGAYLRQVIRQPLQQVRFEAGLSALLIAAIWLLALQRMGLFQHMAAPVVAGAVMVGGLAALLTPVLEDGLWLAGGGAAAQDSWLQVWQVGLPAEAAKLLPLVVLALLSRPVNEPIDLVLYGSLAALGYATLENALLLTDIAGGMIFGRFLLNTLFHITLTAGIGFLWAATAYIRPLQLEAAWPGRIYTGAWVVGGLAGGAALHGGYQAVLHAPVPTLAGALSAVLLAAVYGRTLRSAMRHSPFFDSGLAIVRRVQTYTLVVCFGVIFLTVGFLFDHFHFTTVVANGRLAASAWGTLVIMAAIFWALNELGLREGLNAR